MICSYEPFQVISDGKNLYVITGDDKGAFKVIDPCLTSYSMAIDQPLIEVTSWHDSERQFMAGLQSVNFTFDLRGGSVEYLTDSKDVLLDFFQSASIRDLFGEINRKIEGRG